MLTVTVTNKDGEVLGEMEIITANAKCTANQIANHVVEHALEGKVDGVEFIQCDKCERFLPSNLIEEIDADLVCHWCN